MKMPGGGKKPIEYKIKSKLNPGKTIVIKYDEADPTNVRIKNLATQGHFNTAGTQLLMTNLALSYKTQKPPLAPIDIADETSFFLSTLIEKGLAKEV